MIRLIAAIDNKRGMAKNDHIPWKLPQDVARYKGLLLTHGGNVILGRRTFDAMGYVEGTHFYVVSHQDLVLPKNCTLVKDLDKFMSEFKEDLWVNGGEAVYKATIQYADELYLTKVDGDFNCDQFFPDYSDFKLKKSEGPYTDNQLSFSYQLFVR
jgi:dihydrofolate reductase